MRSADDVRELLRAGADKVSVNTAAISRPQLLRELADEFGAQCIVLSVDARRVPEGATPQPSGFEVTTHGGTRSAGIDAIEWARTGEDLGVGEILLNSMDGDGTKSGFDLELIRLVRAFLAVAFSQLHWIARIAQVFKVHAFDHSPAIHVEARNDSYGDGHGLSLIHI